MKKIKFSILILFSNLLLLLFSCNIQDLRCNSKDDKTIIHNQTIGFTYQSNTEEFIDINNDQIRQCTHYGWIEFSSSPDGGKNSNTPVSYTHVTLPTKA